ncbi:LysR substrate-binding domain-containing protein [Streptomyces sp. NPDC001657]|uniref:LysR substrate-binding domain-containing protein n=1 Tax=Streptomyces sp. NPDC001657 TaxID=3154522 RepID=UPI003316AC53
MPAHAHAAAVSPTPPAYPSSSRNEYRSVVASRRGTPLRRRLCIGGDPRRSRRVTRTLRSTSSRHAEVEIDVAASRWWEQDRPLRDGRTQVDYLRRQLDESGLRIIPIGHHPRGACMPAMHPLAADFIEIATATLRPA